MQIDITFNNIGGAQGSGGPLSDDGSITVNITAGVLPTHLDLG